MGILSKVCEYFFVSLRYIILSAPCFVQIILVTYPRTGDLRESLKYIYNLYVDYVAKNPLYTPGTPIRWLIDIFEQVKILPS